MSSWRTITTSDLDSDEDCDLNTEGGWQVKHHEMRLAKQVIDKTTQPIYELVNKKEG